jgi:hypothetical protein
MSTTTIQAEETEATILARVLCDENGLLPAEMARYILEREFSDRDKARMHDLAVRNQVGALSVAETGELHAFAEAGTVLAILKSKARRTLKIKPKTRRSS